MLDFHKLVVTSNYTSLLVFAGTCWLDLYLAIAERQPYCYQRQGPLSWPGFDVGHSTLEHKLEHSTSEQKQYNRTFKRKFAFGLIGKDIETCTGICWLDSAYLVTKVFVL